MPELTTDIRYIKGIGEKRAEALGRLGIRTLGDLVLDHTTRTATVAGNTLVLTRSEFDLLDLLSGHPGRVYTRPQIIANIQGDDKAVTDRTVDTMMVGLRRKLGAWATHIETIRGIGYRLIP